MSASAGTTPAGSPEAQRRNTTLAITGLAIGMLLSTLDQTIVATALPSISRDMGSLSAVTWVVSAYLLTTTASAPLYGKLSDMYGRRKMVLIAVGVFVVTSALCGAAPNIESLIALRALQGLGGGGLLTLGTAGISDLVPLHERGKALSYSGAVFAIGSVGGPLLGGIFTDYLNWHWVFYINVPLGLIALALVFRYFHSANTGVRGVVDFVGALLLVCAVTCVMLVTVWGGDDYAWASAQIIGLIVAAVVLTAAFILWERRATNPVLPLQLFKARAFRTAVPISFLIGLLLLGAVVFLPEFFQAVRGMSAAKSGLALTPLMLGVVATMTWAGRRVSSTGRYRIFPIIGSVMAIIGFIGFSRLDNDTPVWLMVLEMIVLGLGIGLMLQLIVLVMQNSAEPQYLGVASSTAMFFRSMGGAVGTALFATVLVRELADKLGAAATRAHMPVPSQGDIRKAMTAGSDMPAAMHKAFSDAFASSIHVVYQWALPFTVILLVLAVALPAVPLWTVEFLRKVKADHDAKVAAEQAAVAGGAPSPAAQE